MTKKKATTPGMVVKGTLLLNSTPFYVLLDLAASYSVLSTRSTLQLNLEHVKVVTNYRIMLPNDSKVDCAILYKHVPIFIGEFIFIGI